MAHHFALFGLKPEDYSEKSDILWSMNAPANLLSKPKIAIFGGGYTGLVAASVLTSRIPEAEIHIFEKRSILGGLASGFKEPGWNFSLEHYYHHWFETDSYVKKYVDLWGSREKLIFKSLLTVLETSRGEFVPLDSAIALLKYPQLGFFSKIRMGMVLAFLRFTNNWHALDPLKAQEWCSKWMGRAGFEEIWKPLLVGKFGTKWAPEINMAWLWSRLKTRSKKLGTYQGGYAALTQDAKTWLESRGVRFHLGFDGKIEGKGPYQITSKSGDKLSNLPEKFDSVLVASSPLALGELVQDPGLKTLQTLSRERPALGVRVIILSLTQPLNQERPFYWYSLRRTEACPFLALIEHTHFIPSTEFAGEHLVYLATYLDPNTDALWKSTDEECVEECLRAMKRIRPSISRSEIKRFWIQRERYAQPVMTPNAGSRLPPIEIPGYSQLFFASLGHVYPWDRGTNFALELGENVARKMCEGLGR